jgi:uncharacterized protein YndB with AHSA1/START domain
MAASNPSMGQASNAVRVGDRELVFTRLYDAPRELVYEAWTKPEHIERWWGPKGFATFIYQMEVKPGGEWKLVMRAPDGKAYNNRLVFVEVVPNEKLVYKQAPDENSEQANFEVTVTFVPRGPSQTEVTMRMLFVSAEERERVVTKYHAIEGGKQTMERLAQHLDDVQTGRSLGVREINLVREFDAPRELVFEMWEKPEHMAKWWGPKGFTLTSCEADFRAGGKFKFVMRGPDHKDYPFEGAYMEVRRPEKIVFDGLIHNIPSQKTHTIVTFEDLGTRTRLTLHQEFTSESDATRGAYEGWSQTLDRLAGLIAAERPTRTNLG